MDDSEPAGWSFYTFARGDRNVCDQGVEFVGRVLVLVALPGQPYAHPVRHVPVKHREKAIQRTAGEQIKWVLFSAQAPSNCIPYSK